MSVALLPIGLVAVMQTKTVADTAQANAELALHALTDQAASRERSLLRVARGAGKGLAMAVPVLKQDQIACSRVMTDLMRESEAFSFAGYIETSGVINCSSAGRSVDFSDNAQVQSVLEGQEATVRVNPYGPISQTSIIIVYTPVYDSADVFDGVVAISIPISKLAAPQQEDVRDALVDLITFNTNGDVLTTLAKDGQAIAAESLDSMPSDRTLTDFLGGENEAWTLRDRTGALRIYTVATIEPGLVYALGVWDRSASLARQARGDVLTAIFPALMWAAGLLVALFSVHRLVTRHLQVLGRQMALFTATRRLPDLEVLSDPPTEIRRIQRAFLRMTEALVRDEARLENAVREKSVLVKEIHHRVKNNLQLISSIINMQIRQSETPEAKQVLRQTQDRVLSMATIHRDLYKTNETGLVDVGHLIREVVGKTVEMTPEFEDAEVMVDVDDIWLFPDQAVPMSLLASEAVTNAIKHMPSAESLDGGRWLSVRLSQDEDRNCLFEVENVAMPSDIPRAQGKGMGRKLIRAFATQLGAKVETQDTGGRYLLRVSFHASEFAPPPGQF